MKTILITILTLITLNLGAQTKLVLSGSPCDPCGTSDSLWISGDSLFFLNNQGDVIGIELPPETVAIGMSASDLTSDLTVSTTQSYIRAPYDFIITEVRASVLTAPVGSDIKVDINENGVSILGAAKLTIDAGSKTSVGSATPSVIVDASIADDNEITVDIDAIGGTTAGAGLIVLLLGYIN